MKRASASLSLRLPRGRPPPLGVGGDLFNMTPPSAEAVTPTKDEPKVITETVEGSIAVPAKDVDVVPNGERTIPVDLEPAPDVEKPVTDAQIPVTDAEVPVEPPKEEERTVDKFVLAERPDFNPNPHSREGSVEPNDNM